MFVGKIWTSRQMSEPMELMDRRRQLFLFPFALAFNTTNIFFRSPIL